MKHTCLNRVLSALMALVMVLSLLPLSVLPVLAAHKCPDCEDWIDGSPYCSECYKCDACVELCIECGVCTDCSGSEICAGCSDEEIGSNICLECAYEKGTHCPSCENCYFSVGLWCEECGLCDDCIPIDVPCSGEAGQVICEECAIAHGTHCPACEQCYFEIQSWCEECGQCADCVEIDVPCSGEVGQVICEECAIDQGLHCPSCSECYGESGGEYCSECGICSNCVDICVTDELCIECALEQELHCSGCEVCGSDTTICESCGESCIECAEAFCESCNMCDECVLICQGCGACEECATICPNCEEYCSECEGIWEACEFCLLCCADIAGFEGCDCVDWVCVESTDWEAHFDNDHTETAGGHSVRPLSAWSFDANYHWRKCAYCEDVGHYTGWSRHTYDATGKCTACSYTKNAEIQIAAQPRDVRNVIVQSAEELPDERNVARFSVRAIGSSTLTYKWYMGYYHYTEGRIKYTLLTDPYECEQFSGPELAVLAPTDACVREWYIYCLITDENGNEVRTEDAVLKARHDYQYYEQFRTHEKPYEFAERNQHGHILQCVGEECGEITCLRPHEDEDRDGYCDICDYKIGKIIITKQPKNVKNVLVRSADENYDESNIACFSVEAEGESALTYSWCRKQYVNGKMAYVPLTNPDEGEIYEGPNLKLLFPEDSCCNEYTYACIITDEEGNEIRTVDVTLQAKHNYQYFKYYQSHEYPYAGTRRQPNGHILQCVGEGCGKVSKLRRHVEENNDFCCDVCGYISKIDLVELSITAPVEGQKPNYNVVCGSKAYGSRGTMNNGRYWYVSDNGVDNWKLIDNTKTFQAGKYYKFSVDLETASGYEFDRQYEYNSKVLVSVNGGQKFFAQKTYNKDLAHYITVEYIFGECNDSVIESIVLDNVAEPVAGEKPSYSATVRGNGYVIDTAKNAQLDDYWNNPQKKPHYIKNGIGWFDVTEFDWVYEDEYFIPGHEYQVRAYLKTEDGFKFAYSRYYEPAVSATINSYVADVRLSGSQCVSRQEIDCTFTCQPQEVSTIMLYLDRPQAGKTPVDFAPEFAYPQVYTGDPNYGIAGSGAYWYDSQGNMIFEEDRFVEGEKYKLEIKVVPAKLEGANVCKFAPSVSVYINGQLFEPSGDWDMVYASGSAVYIYYTFTKGASAPDVQQISGDVNGDDAVTNEDVVALLWYTLFPEDNEIRGDADYTGDGDVTNEDVVKLLWYTLFPEDNPLF